MNAHLVAQLDALAKGRGYANRSQAVADLVRAEIVAHRGERRNSEIAGTITIVFDHHKRNVLSLLTGVQHAHADLIISALHVHLDHYNCMEVLAVRGKASAVREMADRLITAKGVKHGKLTVTATGKEF